MYGAGGSSLDRAIKLLNDALPLITNGGQGPDLFLLGDCHRFLYVRRDDSTDLQLALQYLTEAQGFDLGDDKVDAYVALGVIHVERYNRYKKPEDLDKAIETFKTVAGINQHDSSLARNVANTLYYKHKETRDPKWLDEAIDYYEIELATADDNKGGVGRRYYAYGSALVRRYASKGFIADLEKGVEYLETALKHAHKDDAADYAARLDRAREKLALERERAERRRARSASVQSSVASHAATASTSHSVPQTPILSKARPRVLKKTAAGSSTTIYTPPQPTRAKTAILPPQPEVTAEKVSSGLFVSSLQRALKAVPLSAPHARWTRQR